MNSFRAMVVSGKVKKDPSRTWKGVAVEITVENTVYSGIVFEKRQSSISEDKAIRFDTITVDDAAYAAASAE